MNAAVIGYGYWGKIIQRYIEESREFNLMKICSLGELPVSSLFTDKLEDITQDPNIEVAFVCTPISTHYQICKELLTHHKHVFCEKPLVKDTIELEELYGLAEQNQCILYVDYIYTISRSIWKLKDLISEIGEICCIEGEISQFGNFYPQDHVFEVLGVHLFSVLVYLLPDMSIDQYKVNMFGCLSETMGKVYILANKIIDIYFTCSLLSEKKIRIIKIYGTKGSIIFDMMDDEATVRLLKYEQVEMRCYSRIENLKWKFDEKNNIKYVLEDFSRAVTKADNNENARVVRAVNEMLLCLKESWNEKRKDIVKFSER